MISVSPKRLKFFSVRDLDTLTELEGLDRDYVQSIKTVANILPFRVNNYVVEELIDWTDPQNDPMFRLTFPQKEMVSDEMFNEMYPLINGGAPSSEIKEKANELRLQLNPHPAGQLTANVPKLDDEPVPGIQHKYDETCLVFPSAGQTCHAYCTFCFRWAQFVGMPDLKFATDESMRFQKYISLHPEITDVLLTGGDPMVMRADNLAKYIEPFLRSEFDHIQSIRIGTKSLSYWPYRYLSDPDTNQLMQLLERVSNAGKHLAIMAHFNHHQELGTKAAQAAIKRLRSAGAVIRTQSPLLRNINDDANVWAQMWNTQVKLGCIPYYMFIERDTGAQRYFRLPLERCYEIYRDAYNQVSGLARTARGPSMSAYPGKVCVDGILELAGEKVFALSFLQGRSSNWCKRPFYAKYDPNAHWLDQLKPAFGEEKFFFESEIEECIQRKVAGDGPATARPAPQRSLPIFANLN